MSDRDIPESETDWLANCAYGYGFGYTRSQALMEMMKHVHREEDLTVVLTEHRGDVFVGPTGARFE
ncbi:hypothetical protein G7L60_24465, partial [Shigella sonnei]|uniref:hypothetical protein n=1 Tax=Shigella sonnei TaxID=624 RepID=UPI001493F248